ncbi:phage holin family protein [Candidatus Pantoea edessiphila]|nr:phage holin family protein [Candidatus Pantoea edessiphila]
MNTSKSRQGPSKTIIEIGQKIITKMINIVETRLCLAILEIEEEKSKIIKILLMLGFIFLFAALGFVCLLMAVVWSLNPKFRIITITILSVILLSISFLLVLWVLKKLRSSTLLQYTRKELKTDSAIMNNKEDQYNE